MDSEFLNGIMEMRPRSMEIFSPRGPHFKIEPIETELFCGPHLKFGSAVVSLSC